MLNADHHFLNQRQIQLFDIRYNVKLLDCCFYGSFKINEKGFWNNKPIVIIDQKYFRPTEVDSLKGDFSLARKELGWKPLININSLVKEMVREELK